MKLSLTPKLALVFILFAVMLLSGVGTLAHSTGQAAFEASAVTELEATAVEKEAALEGWILEREAALIALSKSPYRLEQLSALTGQAGIKFDPKVVDSFLNLVM